VAVVPSSVVPSGVVSEEELVGSPEEEVEPAVGSSFVVPGPPSVLSVASVEPELVSSSSPVSGTHPRQDITATVIVVLIIEKAMARSLARNPRDAARPHPRPHSRVVVG
jgi:hypothetical protein